jgi:hypothetical protein
MDPHDDPRLMKNDEFQEFVISKMLQGWIPLKTYLTMFPSETASKVDTRLSRGIWKRGVHHTVPRGAQAWVNLNAIREWVVESIPQDDTVLGSETGEVGAA